jgi:hypothetical protein
MHLRHALLGRHAPEGPPTQRNPGAQH